MRVFVVGGSPVSRRPIHLAPTAGDRVIAADLGALHALTWGWPIDLLVGDFDSLPPETEAATEGTPVLRAAVEKDETDLELALDRALAASPQEIVICGALGGRTDHLLANVLLLARSDLTTSPIILADGAETVRLLRGGSTDDAGPEGLTLWGVPGDLVSLLPLCGDAEGVSTRGLYYPLNDESLLAGSARGISNVLTTHHAEITLRRGTLLVIQLARESGSVVSGGLVASGGL